MIMDVAETAAEPQSSATEVVDEGFVATPVVMDLSPDMFRAYCARHSLHFETDQDGDISIRYPYRADRACGLRVYVYRSGESRSIMVVRVRSDKRFRPIHRDQLLREINQYHCDKRWPRIYLRNVADIVEINCESQTDLAAGIHQDLLDDIIDRTIMGSKNFWKWLASRGIPGMHDDAVTE
jgi:hypothetical protein